VWLRGTGLGSVPVSVASRIPIDEVFSLDPSGRLTPAGALLPTRRLPEVCWTPIRDWLVPVLPPPSPPPPRPVPGARLQLVPDPADRLRPNLILTSIDRWLRYCEQASTLRLAPLHFAASSCGEVAVLGSPIPGMAGTAYHLQDRIAIPCGSALDPRVSRAFLAHRLGLPSSALALLSGQGAMRVLSFEDFVPATRSAARLTFEHLCLSTPRDAETH
jgi:hypothetical protein